MLDEKGSPTVTERAWIVPPASRIGPITDAERDAVREQATPLYGHYEQTVDRESAYEKLKARTSGTDGRAARRSGQAGGRAGWGRHDARDVCRLGITGALSNILFGTTGPRGGSTTASSSRRRRAPRARSAPVSGRAILRGALGSILGGSTRRSR